MMHAIYFINGNLHQSVMKEVNAHNIVLNILTYNYGLFG